MDGKTRMVNRRKITEEEAKKVIPEGQYCYQYKNNCYSVCPFWSRVERGNGNEKYVEGWCSYLNETDLLLDDQCKLCAVNDSCEFDEEGNEVE